MRRRAQGSALGGGPPWAADLLKAKKEDKMLGKRTLRLGLGLLAVGAVALAALAAACGEDEGGAAAAPAATKRVIYMSAVEYKGSTEVAKEPFPATKVDNKG